MGTRSVLHFPLTTPAAFSLPLNMGDSSVFEHSDSFDSSGSSMVNWSLQLPETHTAEFEEAVAFKRACEQHLSAQILTPPVNIYPMTSCSPGWTSVKPHSSRVQT